MKKFLFLILPAGLVFTEPSLSQTTFDRVYGILQTNCSGSCHNYGNPSGNLRYDVPKQDLLASLVGIAPDNDYADSVGYKRVIPGDARRSFLFRKVNNGLDANLSLHQGEGGSMPQGLSPLSEVEREMIRQWIIFGAADTGYHYADEQTITDYYNGFAEARDPSLPVPDPSEGRQIYWGPIFLRPGNEIEFDGKFPVYNNAPIEVYKMEANVNKESHHMAVFKYLPGKDTLMEDGLSRVTGIGDAAELFDKAEPIGQWPNSLAIETPQGTALIWDSNTVLNLSYHILNYSDSIIACEVHYNIFTRPLQTGTVPMLSYPVRYDGKPVYEGGWEVGNLIVPPNDPGDSTTLTITQYNNPDSDFWHIWSIQAHTHRLGKDYNVWLRNPNGSKGELIYDGTYDYDQHFDKGVYDWEHPPLRTFNPMQPADMSAGLIHEATFYNDTPDTVGFGLRTTDEMYVTYIFYAKSPSPVGILPDKVFNDANVRIYPNPVHQQAFIRIHPDMTLNHAEFRMYDLMGKEVLAERNIADGKFTVDFAQLPNGSYFYRLINDGRLAASGKVMVVE